MVCGTRIRFWFGLLSIFRSPCLHWQKVSCFDERTCTSAMGDDSFQSHPFPSHRKRFVLVFYYGGRLLWHQSNCPQRGRMTLIGILTRVQNFRGNIFHIPKLKLCDSLIHDWYKEMHFLYCGEFDPSLIQTAVLGKRVERRNVVGCLISYYPS